jgi:hypothetical protein
MVTAKCQERHKLADYLAQLAVGLIVEHEITHIRCGHLGYLTELQAQGKEPSQEESFAMEYGADGVASRMMIAQAMDTHPMAAQIKGVGANNTAFEDNLFLTLLAAYMFFRVYVDEGSVYGHYSKSHPPAFLRMVVMSAVAVNMNIDRPFLPQERLLQIALAAKVEGEKAVALLTNRKPTLDALTMAYTPKSQQMMADLIRNLSALLPKLEKHRYGR